MGITKPVASIAEESLSANFAAMPDSDPLHSARAVAFADIADRGLPHRRIEDWKYTDLRNLMGAVPPPAVAPTPPETSAAIANVDLFEDIDRGRLVFANGHFIPGLSDLAGLEGDIEFHSFGRFLADGGTILDPFQGAENVDSPIQSLNCAFVTDGAVVRVKPGAKLAKPLEIVTLFCGEAPGLQSLRNQIDVGEGAQVTLLQTIAGPDGQRYHTNIVSEIRVGDDAVLNWITAREEGDEAVHLNLMLPRLGARAVFNPFLFAAGGAISRSEMRLEFQGEGAKAAICGTAIAGNGQHGDITLFVDHAVPGCSSQEYFKAALDGDAKGVFQGRILVRPHAQKTDGKMMSQALLLSDRAEFHNKPELEIFADDVTCGHGATCGDIDEEMLFFLRSRGIGKQEAEQLLVQAFLAEAIDEISDEKIAALLEERTWTWLRKRGTDG